MLQTTYKAAIIAANSKLIGCQGHTTNSVWTEDIQFTISFKDLHTPTFYIPRVRGVLLLRGGLYESEEEEVPRETNSFLANS